MLVNTNNSYSSTTLSSNTGSNKKISNHYHINFAWSYFYGLEVDPITVEFLVEGADMGPRHC
jgi:hypothetical protein